VPLAGPSPFQGAPIGLSGNSLYKCFINKIMYIDYIDLPNIPEELLESKNDILSKETLSVNMYEGDALPISSGHEHAGSITRKEVSNKLKRWLQSVCNFPVNARYLILNSSVAIHRDPKYRPRAYNYIIHAGGENVATTVYNDDFTVLKSLVIPERTWYCLDTGRLHGLDGISANESRIVLSINYLGTKQFPE
jgi:hypothetical protein